MHCRACCWEQRECEYAATEDGTEDGAYIVGISFGLESDEALGEALGLRDISLTAI